MASDSRDLPGGRPEAASAETAAEAVGRDPELVELEHRHNSFVWPVTIFFLVYYLSLSVLAGAAPDFMGKKLFGQFTFGYLFALSQFLMAFIVAWAYSRFARRRIDPLAADLRNKLHARNIKGGAR
jgi:uncharacterized membrane protein (DUF485 family)